MLDNIGLLCRRKILFHCCNHPKCILGTREQCKGRGVSLESFSLCCTLTDRDRAQARPSDSPTQEMVFFTYGDRDAPGARGRRGGYPRPGTSSVHPSVRPSVRPNGASLARSPLKSLSGRSLRPSTEAEICKRENERNGKGETGTTFGKRMQME